MVGATDRDGLVSPVYHSLRPQTIMGIPKPAVILNTTLTALVVHLSHIWWLLGVGIGLHLLAYVATKRDPEWLQIALGYWKTQRYYEV